MRLQNEKSPPFFIKRKFNNKRGKGFKILKGFSCFFTRFLFFLLKIPHTPSKIVHFIQALGNTFQYWTHHAHVLIGGVDHQESSEIIMLSLCLEQVSEISMIISFPRQQFSFSFFIIFILQFLTPLMRRILLWISLWFIAMRKPAKLVEIVLHRV